jgi:glycosyltransferase involved in cell wall biosynthesis
VKVLFSLLDAGVGGGQQVAFDVAEELTRRGHRIGVVVPEAGPATERFASLGADIHVAPLVSLRHPGVRHGARIARGYDVVYSHSSVPGEILGGVAAFLARRPHAVHRHVYPHFSPRPSVRTFQRGLYRTVVRRARVVAVAEHIADALEQVGIPKSRISVIPNGVVVPAEPAPARSTDRTRVGLLGRLDPQKGADVFMEAAAHLGGVAAFVLGAPNAEGPYAEQLLPAARAANVDVVIPAGPEFLRDVDIVAFPSRYEGHPLTLLEAMALGKPIVASAIPGVREVLAPDDAGLLVPPDNPHALASALRRLLVDPDLCRRLGARAREVATSRYDLAHVQEQLIGFLEETAARAPS